MMTDFEEMLLENLESIAKSLAKISACADLYENAIRTTAPQTTLIDAGKKPVPAKK